VSGPRRTPAVAVDVVLFTIVERALRVGSLEAIVDPRRLRPLLIRQLEEARTGAQRAGPA